MRFYKIIFFTLSFSTPSIAQIEKSTTYQKMFWARYYNIVSLNEKWSIHSEIENRSFISPIKQSLIDVQFSVKYKLNDQLEMGAGYAYFLSPIDIPQTDDKFYIGEQRLKQDAVYKITRNSFTVNNRLQLEERWLENANTKGLISGHIFTIRLRYRLQLEYVIWKKSNNYLKGIVYDEIMFNLNRKSGDTHFEQNRYYIGAQTGLNKSLSFEVGYLNSYQLKINGYQFSDRDIIRVTLLQKLKI